MSAVQLRKRDFVHARETSSLPGERELVFADALVRAGAARVDRCYIRLGEPGALLGGQPIPAHGFH